MGRYKIEERGEVHTDMRVGRGGCSNPTIKRLSAPGGWNGSVTTRIPTGQFLREREKKTAATK